MKRVFRRTFSLCLCVVIVLLSSCKYLPPPTEINENVFVLAAGVDKSFSNPAGVRLSVVSKDMNAGDGAGGGKSGSSTAALVYTGEGDTIFDATRKMRGFTYNDLFWGHCKVVVFGEEAGKVDISRYIDFFMRDHESRGNMLVLMAHNASAEQIVAPGKGIDVFVPDLLESLAGNTQALSFSKSMTVSDTAVTLNDDYTSLIMPCVSLRTGTGIADKDYTYIDYNGYAVFNWENKLIGYLLDNEGRGVNWLTDNIEGGLMVTKDDKDAYVSIEIIESSTKIKVQMKDGKPSVEFSIKTACNIGEQQSSEDLLFSEKLDKLKALVSKLIETEAGAVLKYAQEHGLDFIGVSGYFARGLPKEWEKLKKNWPAEFSGMEMSVKVEAELNRVYLLEEPIEHKEQ